MKVNNQSLLEVVPGEKACALIFRYGLVWLVEERRRRRGEEPAEEQAWRGALRRWAALDRLAGRKRLPCGDTLPACRGLFRHTESVPRRGDRAETQPGPEQPTADTRMQTEVERELVALGERSAALAALLPDAPAPAVTAAAPPPLVPVALQPSTADRRLRRLQSRRPRRRPPHARAFWPVLLGCLVIAGLGFSAAFSGWLHPHFGWLPAFERTEQVNLGDKVRADQDPAFPTQGTPAEQIDPATWHTYQFQAPKFDGSWAEVRLLRGPRWVAENHPRIGGKVPISRPECGIGGQALVLGIGPCPRIASGPGLVVTGVFKHVVQRTVALYLEGQGPPIGPTPNHRFWSLDRHAWVAAIDLRPGERLDGLVPDARVGRLEIVDGPQTVYNLEIQLTHVYRVGPQGLLVHNPEPCAAGGPLQRGPDPMGKVDLPADLKPGTVSFGNEMHARIADWLQRRFPGAKFSFQIEAAQTDIDITVLEGKRGSRIRACRYQTSQPGPKRKASAADLEMAKEGNHRHRPEGFPNHL